ncbi:helix-turn-helix transcriptional regulator [Acrocarpospora sp. B8E8]|uniref:helix-turn-helix domain-containing protein n=1 Tax=Acrocarpospora sp. B8E8 TaxID=3153572 RepID=UPI00325EB1FA
MVEPLIPPTTSIREQKVPRTSDHVEPSTSPWHLLGAAIRHWREDVKGISQRETAKITYIDRGDLSKWERGLTRPHPSVVKRLDTTLEANGYLVALHAFSIDLDRLRTLEAKGTATEETTTERRRLLQFAAGLALGSVGGSEHVRQLFDLDLTRDMEDWEITCADHLHALRTRPPAQVIADLAIDLLAVERQMKIATPADLIELHRVLAALSAVYANALTRMADHGAAIRWWRTARQAADASGDHTMSLLIRGEEAGHGLYGQRTPDAVLHLVRAAERFAGSASVDLMSTEAKALSMVGRHEEALAVVRRMMDLAGTAAGDPLGFWTPDRQIHFAASWTYAAAGDEVRADAEREAVLALTSTYPHSANVVLHGAMCTVVKGGIREGAQQAATLIANLPATHRSNHVIETGRMVLRAIPMDHRDHPAVGELNEVLTTEPHRPNGP